ncbi:hypothetical protein L873DRAFT_1814583 [Choiromyces venosus 120613-1]|uniref:Uncharacterized protein n=1 Tax=Choiromyces venosus 120613-1 TaxID=1336337 RepID=A0A3N4JAB7_9PEZI|nr:hypothetical protein L873DRAFT_1814583 [Choiromyces venosus 120613-1]
MYFSPSPSFLPFPKNYYKLGHHNGVRFFTFYFTGLVLSYFLPTRQLILDAKPPSISLLSFIYLSIYFILF